MELSSSSVEAFTTIWDLGLGFRVEDHPENRNILPYKIRVIYGLLFSILSVEQIVV